MGFSIRGVSLASQHSPANNNNHLSLRSLLTTSTDRSHARQKSSTSTAGEIPNNDPTVTLTATYPGARPETLESPTSPKTPVGPAYDNPPASLLAQAASQAALSSPTSLLPQLPHEDHAVMQTTNTAVASLPISISPSRAQFALKLSASPPTSAGALPTPPDEHNAMNWSLGFASGPGRNGALSFPNTRSDRGSTRDADPVPNNDDGLAAHLSDNASTSLGASPQIQLTSPPTAWSWSDRPVTAILNLLSTRSVPSGNLQVLSQALPTPSDAGHAFPDFIKAIRSRYQLHPLLWINLIHAIPGSMSLENMPTSPPHTPGQPTEGEDYFTAKVFDTAVPAIDYESDVSGLRPFTPRHLSPPSSSNLSIVERYLPPPSSRELAGLYDSRGTSILTDRMIELSEDNGCLVFIYPTKRGGQAFMRECLGPILDPLLRSMMIMHNLSDSFSAALGSMNAVNLLEEFEVMQQRIAELCANLSENEELAFHGPPGTVSTFELVYSSTHDVSIDHAIWSDWWVRQEKPRLRNFMTQYFRMGRRASGTQQLPDVSQGNLVQQIVDGVQARTDSERAHTPIEVGVFVVSRRRL